MITLLYGDITPQGVRPNRLIIDYPAWEISGAFTLPSSVRMSITPVDDGVFVEPLEKSEVRQIINVAYVPQRDAARIERKQHWMLPLETLRGLLGQAVTLQWGNDDWGDGWFVESVNINLTEIGHGPIPGISTGRPRQSLFARRIPVTINLVTAPENAVFDPANPEDVVETVGE